MTGPRKWQMLVDASLVWLCVVTLLRTLREPNVWAKSYWLINYDYGFIKRALAGTLAKPFTQWQGGHENAEVVVTVIASILLVVLSVALLQVGRGILARLDYSFVSVLAVSAFLTSPYVIMSAHVIGYFDCLIALAMILSCALLRRGRTVWVGICLGLCLLTHESIMVLAFPTLAFLHIFRLSNSDAPRAGLVNSLKLATIPAAVTLVLMLNQALWVDVDAVNAGLTRELAQFDFLSKGRSAELVIATNNFGFSENFESYSPKFSRRFLNPTEISLVMPTVVTLLALCYGRLRRRADGARRAGLIALAASISMVPLAGLAVAWDTERIWTYPLIVSFVMLWALCYSSEPEGFASSSAGDGSHPARPTRSRTWTRWLQAFCVVVVIALNVMADNPLMDRELERFERGGRALLLAPGFIALIVGVIGRRRALSRQAAT